MSETETANIKTGKKPSAEVILCVILGLVILFEFVSYLYLNFFPQTVFVDEDFAKLARHTMEMGKNRTIFLQHWDYLTTGEFDCAAILALPFYMLTGNIYLAFAIANTINIVLWGLLIWNLLKTIRVRTLFRLLAIALILTLFDLGMLSYTNLMFFFGGQYVYKTMIPILFAFLLLIPKEKRWKIGMILFYALLLVLSLLTGMSSGLYVFACGVAPVILCAIVYSFYDKDKKETLYRALISATVCIAGLLGIVICRMNHVNPNTENMFIRFTYNYIDSLRVVFNQQIEIYDPFFMPDIPATSFKGIVACARWAMVGLIFSGWLFAPKFLALQAHRKDLKEQPDNRFFAEAMLISIMIWNFLVLFVTTSSPRYHLIGCIPLMLCAILLLERVLGRMKPFVTVIAIVFIALAIQGINTQTVLQESKAFFNHNDYYLLDLRECDSLIHFFDEREIDTVFFFDASEMTRSKETEALRFLDEDRVYETLYPDGTVINFDYYYTERDCTAFTSKNAILVIPEEYDRLPDFVKANYSEAAAFGSYMILCSDENPIDGISLVEKGLHTIDLPTTPGYVWDGVIDRKGFLHANVVGSALKSSEIAADTSFEYVLHYEFEGDGQAMLYIYEKNAEDGVYNVIPLDSSETQVSVSCEPGTYTFEIVKSDENMMVIGQMEFNCD